MCHTLVPAWCHAAPRPPFSAWIWPSAAPAESARRGLTASASGGSEATSAPGGRSKESSKTVVMTLPACRTVAAEPSTAPVAPASLGVLLPGGTHERHAKTAQGATRTHTRSGTARFGKGSLTRRFVSQTGAPSSVVPRPSTGPDPRCALPRICVRKLRHASHSVSHPAPAPPPHALVGPRDRRGRCPGLRRSCTERQREGDHHRLLVPCHRGPRL